MVIKSWRPVAQTYIQPIIVEYEQEELCGFAVKPKYAVRKVSGYPGANRREARKLGLLHKQKFRSRTRAIEAAGAE